MIFLNKKIVIYRSICMLELIQVDGNIKLILLKLECIKYNDTTNKIIKLKIYINISKYHIEYY